VLIVERLQWRTEGGGASRPGDPSKGGVTSRGDGKWATKGCFAVMISYDLGVNA